MNQLNVKNTKYDVVVVGGGLGGLTISALLSNEGKNVLLLEKAKLGGRAMTMNIKGFLFNMGAHAVYGRDVSKITELQNKLGLEIDWLDFSKNKAVYDLGSELSSIPSDINSLVNTKMLKGMEKFLFGIFVLKTMSGLNKVKDKNFTINEWFNENKTNSNIRKFMLSLAASNFFTGEPEKILATVFFDYYKRMFQTKKPVSYIKGGWQTLIDSLEKSLLESGGDIRLKEKIQEINLENDVIKSIVLKDSIIEAENFVFCIPPNELLKVFKDNQELFQTYNQYSSTNVMFYDVGLENRIESDYTYINDIENKIFITDISYYDKEAAPENGQLLQAVKLLTNDDMKSPEVIEEHKIKVEALYDKFFPGWRGQLTVPKISKNAVVQYVKWDKGQSGMPIKFSQFKNIYFAGDWCEGEGQLSELSFSSAFKVFDELTKQE